jgi:DNA-binding transcriptional LysR family regulator
MDFAAAYPQVQLDVVFEDRFIDMVAERFDVAIRISELADSSLIAKKLAPYRVVVICATPELIAEHGAPKAPEDMSPSADHRRQQSPGEAGLHLRHAGGAALGAHQSAVMSINAPHAIRMAALAGLGILPGSLSYGAGRC